MFPQRLCEFGLILDLLITDGMQNEIIGYAVQEEAYVAFGIGDVEHFEEKPLGRIPTICTPADFLPFSPISFSPLWWLLP